MTAETGAAGGNLLFLVCQPRSGSTLLQHILAGHPDVHTTVEPWLLLWPLLQRRPGAVSASFHADYARVALEDFLATLPDGEGSFREAVRRYATTLYEAALAHSGRRVFLDKTPRYYWVLEEIASLFPAARLVVLLRNPVAVLCSILDTSLGGDWRGLRAPDRRHDLLTAPRAIADFLRGDNGGRAAVVRYEDLVGQPAKTVRGLCERIGLAFDPAMLRYGGRLSLPERGRDSKAIYRHDRPVAAYADAWRERVRDAQMAELARGYVEALGADLLAALGYPREELLEAIPEAPRRNRSVVPWEAVLGGDAPPRRRARVREAASVLLGLYRRSRPPRLGRRRPVSGAG